VKLIAILLWWQAEGKYWCWGHVSCSYLRNGHPSPWPPQRRQVAWGNWKRYDLLQFTYAGLRIKNLFCVVRMVPWMSLSASATRALTVRLVPWSRYVTLQVGSLISYPKKGLDWFETEGSNFGLWLQTGRERRLCDARKEGSGVGRTHCSIRQAGKWNDSPGVLSTSQS